MASSGPLADEGHLLWEDPRELDVHRADGVLILFQHLDHILPEVDFVASSDEEEEEEEGEGEVGIPRGFSPPLSSDEEDTDDGEDDDEEEVDEDPDDEDFWADGEDSEDSRCQSTSEEEDEDPNGEDSWADGEDSEDSGSQSTSEYEVKPADDGDDISPRFPRGWRPPGPTPLEDLSTMSPPSSSSSSSSSSCSLSSSTKRSRDEDDLDQVGMKRPRWPTSPSSAGLDN